MLVGETLHEETADACVHEIPSVTEILVKLSTENNILLFTAPTGRVTAAVHGEMSPLEPEHVTYRAAPPRTVSGDLASIEAGRITSKQMAHKLSQASVRTSTRRTARSRSLVYAQRNTNGTSSSELSRRTERQTGMRIHDSKWGRLRIRTGTSSAESIEVRIHC